MRRSMIAIGIVLAGMCVGAPARATTTEQCVFSATEADRLRRDPSALRAARDNLQLCSRDDCPELIRKDCRAWLSEVDDSIPTVVLLAEDASGQPLLTASVAVDGAPLGQPLDGRPLQLDVGVHSFVFRLGEETIERTTVLVAHQKDALVRARFGPSIAAVTPGPVAAPQPPSSSASPVDKANDTTATVSRLPKVGLAVAGVGAAALGVGAFFGLRALAKQDSAQCPNNVCGVGSRPDDLRDAKTAGNLSTGFFVAGGALAATGIALFIFGPRRSQPSSASVSQARRAAMPRDTLAVIPYGLGLSLAWEAY